MISFVCGQLCSGKTVYSKSLMCVANGTYIEVGDIVRKIKNTADRKILQDTKELYQQIVEHIKNAYNTSKSQQLIVSGVRQMEILTAFPDATVLWIECPKEERKKRYQERAREGDSQSFEEAEAGDIHLGILGVKQYIFNKHEIL
jgi:dephospho-CoA kinase